MNGASLRHRFGLARRSWLVFFACLLASLAPSCGDPEPIVVESPEIAVLVTVEGLTPEITSLFMTTTLAGKPAQQGHEFTGRLDQLAVYLPRETSGLLNLRLVGRSSERCLVASGEAQVSVVPAPPTRYDVKITLAAAAAGAPKACALTVLVKGKGSVESTPPGISCVGTGPTTSQCSYDFAVGSQISLSATADAKSIGVLWGGDCSGTAACSFTHNKPTNITADFAPRICSPNNWCWYAPLPQGSTLRGMWGSSAKDVWAVGDFGTILHYDGATWAPSVPAGSLTQNDFYAVWGTSASDAWAVGSAGTLAHYDGKTWTLSGQSGVTTTQTLRGVWGDSASSYWAVGNSGVILRFNASGWSIANGSGVVAGTLFGIWGASPTSLWAVGNSGVILAGNGTTWVRDPFMGANFNTLLAVRGTQRDSVVAVGTGGSLYRYDGTAWRVDPKGGAIGSTSPSALTILPSGATWVVGFGSAGRFDGTNWQAVPYTLPYSLTAVWGTSDTDLWAVGGSGVMVRYDGQALTPGPLTEAPVNTTWESAWASGPSDIWTVGSGGFFRRFDGTKWTTSAQSGVITTSFLQRVYGFSPTSIFAVGTGGAMLRYDGTAWSPITGSGTVVTNNLYGLYGSSATNMWVVGDTGTLAFFNGSTLTKDVSSGMLTTATVYAAWGPAGSSFPYAVTSAGQVLRYVFSWSLQVTPPVQPLYGLWGSAATNAWAVGGLGALLKFNGSAWAADAQSGVLTTATLYDVWGANASNVWAVGSNGTIARYNGTAWTLEQSGTRNYLGGIWGTATDSVWAVGSSGTILRYQP